jgi:hypothetical protein
MRTIAVMDGYNEENYINYLDHVLNLLQVEHSISNMVRLKNTQPDYVVLNSSNKEVKELNLKADYCFANMDNSFSGNINIFGNMITYGFGIKNTVTISSVEENNEGFVLCIQRYLSLGLEEALVPQEIPVSLKFNNDTELYAAMAAITIALLEGMSSSYIEKKLSKKVLILT